MSTLLEMRIDELEEKNAALAAQVEALRNAASDAAEALGFLSHHLRGRMGESALMDMAEKADSLNEVLNATAQQHLAEIRAEAVLRFAGHVLAQYRYDVTEWAKQYADSIRQGGTE